MSARLHQWLYGSLLCLALLCLILGCATPRENTSAAAPDSGISKEATAQDGELKLKFGRPAPPQGEDKADLYERRGNGPLEDQAIGVQGIWRF